MNLERKVTIAEDELMRKTGGKEPQRIIYKVNDKYYDTDPYDVVIDGVPVMEDEPGWPEPIDFPEHDGMLIVIGFADGKDWRPKIHND